MHPNDNGYDHQLRAALLAPLAPRGKPRPALEACLGLSYARVSKSVQTSIPDQHRAIKRAAAAAGVPIELELDDEGSRWDNERAGYLRLKREAETGRYSHVWLFMADRLGGDDVEFIGTVRHLLRLGLKVCDTVFGEITDQHVGMLGFLSHMEIKHVSERTINALEGKAAAGVKLGYPPVGYAVACKLHPCKCGRHGKFVPGPHFEIVGELFRRYAAGQPLSQVQQWFNCQTGLRRRPAQIREILSQPYYWGLIVNNRERKSKVLGPHARPREEWTVSNELHEHPAIDKDTFDRCQARMAAQPHKRAHYGQNTGYGLSGLIWCSHCDRRMVAHRAKNVELRCAVCHTTRGYSKVERAIRRLLDEIPVPCDDVATAAVGQLQREREELQEKLGKIDAGLARLARRRQALMIREAEAESDEERTDARAAYRSTDHERAAMVRERLAVETALMNLPAHSGIVSLVLERLQGCEHWTDLLDGADVPAQQELYRQSIGRAVWDREAGTLTVEYTPPVARWYGVSKDTVKLDQLADTEAAERARRYRARERERLAAVG